MKSTSQFEVGHNKQTEEVVQHAWNCSDKNRWKEKHEFEAKQKELQYPQNAQERDDLTNQLQVPTIQSLQKTVGRSTEGTIH